MKWERISIRFDFLGLSLHSHNSTSFHTKNFWFVWNTHTRTKKKKTTPQKHDHFSIGYQNIKNIRGIGGKDYQLAGNRRLQSLRGLESNMIGGEKLRDRDDFTNSSRYRRQGKISISPESELETGINESRDFAVVHRIRTNKHWCGGVIRLSRE